VTSRPRLVGAVVAALIGLGSVACSSNSSGLPTPRVGGPCAAKPAAGALCIDVIAKNGVVGDVIGYLASTESPLSGERWRLVLTTYGCDPGSGATPSCAATKTYPGPTRHGVPPIQSDCRRSNGTIDRTSAGCHNTLAEEVGTQGDWSGFALPTNAFTVRQQTWFCVSEQVDLGRVWGAPTVAPAPVRTCSSVSPA
jgi:hypothetical protein